MALPADSDPARLRLPAGLESLEPFQDFVRTRLQAVACTPEAQFRIQLAVEEILVNIFHYAYPAGSGGWAELACRVEDGGRRLQVEMRDAGRAFDPLAQGRPDTLGTLEQRRIGGLGIFLARQMAQTTAYRRDGEQNVLIMEFALDAAL